MLNVSYFVFCCDGASHETVCPSVNPLVRQQRRFMYSICGAVSGHLLAIVAALVFTIVQCAFQQNSSTSVAHHKHFPTSTRKVKIQSCFRFSIVLSILTIAQSLPLAAQRQQQMSRLFSKEATPVRWVALFPRVLPSLYFEPETTLLIHLAESSRHVMISVLTFLSSALFFSLCLNDLFI